MGRPDADPSAYESQQIQTECELQPQEYEPNHEATPNIPDDYVAATYQNNQEDQQYQPQQMVALIGNDPQAQQQQFQPQQIQQQFQPQQPQQPPPAQPQPRQYPPPHPNQAYPPVQPAPYPPQNLQNNPAHPNWPNQQPASYPPQPVQYPPKSPPTNQIYSNVSPPVMQPQTVYVP
ncbi:calcium-binding protein P-like isoform X2 [Durio zibethinus]|uniref:Calcium-binding protein P-like isoform X1 n=1 Tax=Durio zibethinus TaxID=66656 RepID=A0A6P6ALZ0_DURZI|nr:calcium-binding protein P-like isoform X1 [Durio zibethinus]XP_022765877.1 calcium-binding protein P-like isoform X2 [Durio zibethinus]